MNKNDFLSYQRVWKAIKCQGKIREKSGNYEVDDKWQPCSLSSAELKIQLVSNPYWPYTIRLSELQIRGSYEDNSKIIFLIFQRKHML